MNQLTTYLQLIRFKSPIGFYLLLYPTLWAVFLNNWTFKELFLFTTGCLITRSAGCIINDIFDKNFDDKVERTRNRPLASGTITTKDAWILFAILLIAGLCVLYLLDIHLIIYALIAVVLLSCYQIAKRFVAIPQAVLGLAYSFGIIMVFAYFKQPLDIKVWLLYCAILLWTIAYDTYYAKADMNDDLTINIHSSAIFFGKFYTQAIIILQIATAILWAISFYLFNLPSFIYLFIATALIFMLQQTLTIANTKPLQAFFNSHFAGLIILIGIMLV